MLISSRHDCAAVSELPKVALAHQAAWSNTRIRHIERMNVVFPGNTMFIQLLSDCLCREQWSRMVRVNWIRVALRCRGQHVLTVDLRSRHGGREPAILCREIRRHEVVIVQVVAC